MNLPNKLTLCRMAAIPFIVAMMMIGAPWSSIIALILFVLAAFTDFLDGHIARKNQIVTDFGKFLDPIADKLLVLSTLIMLSQQGKIAAWIVILILARELCVDGLRLIAVTKGLVIAAGKLGKIKTVLQIVLIVWLMIGFTGTFSSVVGTVLTVAVVAMTFWSGVDYFIRNKGVIASK